MMKCFSRPERIFSGPNVTAWTSLRNWPAIVNGFGLLPVGSPEPRTRLPLHVLVVDLVTATRLNRTFGWPLNQKGFPAASFWPETGSLGSTTTSGGGCFPMAGNVTVWKPRKRHWTVSPWWTVTARGKNAFDDACLGSPGDPSAPASAV